MRLDAAELRLQLRLALAVCDRRGAAHFDARFGLLQVGASGEQVGYVGQMLVESKDAEFALDFGDVAGLLAVLGRSPYGPIELVVEDERVVLEGRNALFWAPRLPGRGVAVTVRPISSPAALPIALALRVLGEADRLGLKWCPASVGAVDLFGPTGALGRMFFA